ncbi:MAG: dolichyl-phosphate beta-glucosyltransferase, partial [Candidatus Sulfotelmatobacter sp.]
GRQFSVLSSQFSVLSSQFSVLSSQFSVLSSQFSVLSSQFSVIGRWTPVSRFLNWLLPTYNCSAFSAFHGLMDITYSIVIPAFNEGARLGTTLEKVLGYLREQGWSAEVIVVNDGSRDNTADLVREFAERNPMLRLVENPGNRGKGYAVRNGMLNARGEVVVFSDADLSSPIEEMPKLLAALASGTDIAIGSRWLRAELQTRRQSLHRQLFGRVFNLLLRIILGLQFKDTQCGFKAFTRRAAQTILPLQRIERWGFDPEILFLARKFGFRVEEVPVLWGHSGDTRIHPLLDGARMFWEMLRIRWYDLTGKYGASAAVSGRPVKTLPGGPASRA